MRLTPRRQGDLGEFSAIEWFGSQGAYVCVPVGSAPDYDLVADYGDGPLRVQVKTCTRPGGPGRFQVQICTRGGNQSWNRVAKYFDPSRCDLLFVHVTDGRCWCIPANAVEGRTAIVLGGPKYAEFEVEPGRPLSADPAA